MLLISCKPHGVLLLHAEGSFPLWYKINWKNSLSADCTWWATGRVSRRQILRELSSLFSCCFSLSLRFFRWNGNCLRSIFLLELQRFESCWQGTCFLFLLEGHFYISKEMQAWWTKRKNEGSFPFFTINYALKSVTALKLLNSCCQVEISKSQGWFC